MKNFKLLLLLTAIIFAIGSAFTANKKAVAGEYVLEGNTFTIVEHSCELSPGDICNYTKIGSATTPQYPNQYQNPANFIPHIINARAVEP